MKKGIVFIFSAVLVSLAWSGSLHADGKEIFEKNCKSCHGADGKGSAAMATGMKVDASALDLTKVATKGKPDAELEAVVKDGKGGKMPAFGTRLNADQIKDVVKFIKALP